MCVNRCHGNSSPGSGHIACSASPQDTPEDTRHTAPGAEGEVM